METASLYKKLRPQTLNDYVGHVNTVKTFKKYAKENKYPSAVFISGQPGIGKTTLMKIYAQMVLCENKDKEGLNCGKCKSCLSISKDESNLSFYSENANHLSIDRIRKLIDIADSKSWDSNNIKFFMFDEIQSLAEKGGSQPVLSAFLDFIEEERKDVFFVLATMNEAKLPEIVRRALRRRCQCFNLKPASDEEMLNYLSEICKKESILDVENNENKVNTLLSITDNANGSYGEAIAILQRVIDGELWTPEELYSELKIISSNTIIELTNKLIRKDISILETQELDNNIIDVIRYNLINIYKKISGFSFQNWQLKKMQGLDFNVEKDYLQNSISILLDLIKMPYVQRPHIEFAILNCINYQPTQYSEQKTYENLTNFFEDKSKKIEEIPDIKDLKNIDNFKKEMEKEQLQNDQKKKYEEEQRQKAEENKKRIENRKRLAREV